MLSNANPQPSHPHAAVLQPCKSSPFETQIGAARRFPSRWHGPSTRPLSTSPTTHSACPRAAYQYKYSAVAKSGKQKQDQNTYDTSAQRLRLPFLRHLPLQYFLSTPLLVQSPLQLHATTPFPQSPPATTPSGKELPSNSMDCRSCHKISGRSW